MRCAAHVINLVAEDFLKSLEATISLIGRLSKSKTNLAEKKRKEKSISSGKRKMTRTTRFTAQHCQGTTNRPMRKRKLDLDYQKTKTTSLYNDWELPTYSDAVNRVRFAGAYILSSAKRKRTFFRTARTRCFPSQKPRQGNTTFLMLQRAQRIKQELLTATVDEEARRSGRPKRTSGSWSQFSSFAMHYGASMTFQKEGADTSVGIQVITMNELSTN